MTPLIKSAVHPRGRGEQTRKYDRLLREAGSSPRARGTGYGRVSSGCWKSVHPRGRGEQANISLSGNSGNGSSPRARGTVSAPQADSTQRRFIPAGAGNRSSSTMTARTSPVHPRGRGEQALTRHDRHPRAGSSPRARGTVWLRPEGDTRLRFIPAGAGNRARRAPQTPPASVHPRGRGEQSSMSDGSIWRDGSSPRARGTERLTRLYPSLRAVHPRGRGEQISPPTSALRWPGSSPRARGTVAADVVRQLPDRFIPAGAGNRQTPTSRAR